MVICSLDALKKSSKKEEARMKKETVELVTKERDRDDEILGFDLGFVMARITPTLTCKTNLYLM